jgi:hypothetical protein
LIGHQNRFHPAFVDFSNRLSGPWIDDTARHDTCIRPLQTPCHRGSMKIARLRGPYPAFKTSLAGAADARRKLCHASVVDRHSRSMRGCTHRLSHNARPRSPWRCHHCGLLNQTQRRLVCPMPRQHASAPSHS